MFSCVVVISTTVLFGVLTAIDLHDAILSVVSGTDDVIESLATLQSAQLEELPVRLRDVVNNSNHGEHMCCRNIPITLVTKSRHAKRVTQEKSLVKTATHHCGFLGTGSCDTYAWVYREVITYVTEYFKDIDYQQCPDRHIVCCNYYIMVAGKCVHLDDLHSIVQEIIG